MQVKRRVRLEDRRANPPRVYEMTLVQVNANDDGRNYVVNFSYGREGKVLSESSKTVRPVALERAIGILEQEVQSKVRLGYELISDDGGQETSTDAPAAEAPSSPQAAATSTTSTESASTITSTAEPTSTKSAAAETTPTEAVQEISNDSQAVSNSPELAAPENPEHVRALVKALKKGDKRSSRAAWRLGLMRAASAVPELEAALASGKGNAMLQYSAVWALGRCGQASSVPVLRAVKDRSPMLSAARAACGDAQELAQMKAGLGEHQALLNNTELNNTDEDQMAAMLSQFARREVPADPELFILLYVLRGNNEALARALANAIGKLALCTPVEGWFRAMRKLAKLAEFYDDPIMYVAVLRWFETNRAMFDNTEYAYIWLEGEGSLWGEELTQELKKPDSRIAYSSRTRDYFKRRFWRHLRSLGEVKSPRYAEIAAQLLLVYTDADKTNERTSKVYSWEYSDRWQRVLVRSNHYSAWAPYLSLNHVLYRNSTRYKLSQSRRVFVQASTEGGNAREEAFPELWDKRPDLILQVLLNAEAVPVAEFAAVAIQAHMDYLRDLPIEMVIDLLHSPSTKVAELGFALAKDRYDANQPNEELVDALLDSESEHARRFGMECVQRSLNHFSKDVDFVVSSLTSRYADVRQGLKLVYGAAPWTTAQQELVVGKIIGVIHSYKDVDEESVANSVIADLGFAMQALFPSLIKTISLEVIDDLLQHPLNEAQGLGARLLLNHQTPPEQLPAGVIANLINADNPEVRGIGVRLFGDMPDEVLLEQDQVFVALFASEHQELRENARPAVGRLARRNEAFAARVVNGLLLVLLESEKGEGHHDFILDILRNELASGLSSVSDQALWTLLRAQSKTAQQMGAQVLAQQTDARKFSVRKLSSLGNHRLLDVRMWVQNVYRQEKDYICTDLENGIRLMDTDWSDTLAFSAEYFENEIDAEHWTPDVLVAVCDSTRPEVQAIGRRILIKFFETDRGEDYLLKLAQHPSTDMQMFASTLLQEYAADKPKTILSLKFYFRVVLGQVYKGRVAKSRALEFLLNEARKSQEVAEMVAEMVTDQSLTIAVMDKARCIALLTELKDSHPAIPSSVSVVAAEHRG